MKGSTSHLCCAHIATSRSAVARAHHVLLADEHATICDSRCDLK